MEKRPMNTTSECKAEITYPCRWQYKLIGQELQGMREAVAQNVKDSAYTLTPSNVSSGGRYVSMSLDVTVHSEEERLDLYNQLAGHKAVKVVL